MLVVRPLEVLRGGPHPQPLSAPGQCRTGGPPALQALSGDGAGTAGRLRKGAFVLHQRSRREKTRGRETSHIFS